MVVSPKNAKYMQARCFLNAIFNKQREDLCTNCRNKEMKMRRYVDIQENSSNYCETNFVSNKFNLLLWIKTIKVERILLCV